MSMGKWELTFWIVIAFLLGLLIGMTLMVTGLDSGLENL